MLKTKQMPKNTKKKLKNTKIIGGKNIAAFTLREKLELLSNISLTYLHSYIEKLVKHNIIGETSIADDVIKDYINFKPNYTFTYTTNVYNFIKYVLLCLDDHDDISYLLLKKKNENVKNYSAIFDDDGDIQDEAVLLQKAGEYYTTFKTLVENLVENIEKTEETNDTKFKDYMYDIYSDGIILLTAGNDDSVHNLKQYKKNSTETEITEIVDFFKEKRDCLIIKKDMNDASNDNYLYDCMLQIINKLARTLLEKLGEEALNKTGTFSKDALENAVEAVKRKAEEA
jgi:hypothetical protein